VNIARIVKMLDRLPFGGRHGLVDVASTAGSGQLLCPLGCPVGNQNALPSWPS
jgi:hypothetical protein